MCNSHTILCKAILYPHLNPEVAPINEPIWLLSVLQFQPLSQSSGESKRPGSPLDVPDDIRDGYMASAGKTATNIGIIKSDHTQ